jgi:hypothetical protein
VSFAAITLCVQVEHHKSLTLALDEGEWQVSRLEERALVTHWVGGSMVPRTDLKAVAKRENPCLCWESNTCSLVRSTVAVLTQLLQS